ncbi:MAG: helicase associated domain-containing protein [Actinomycetota bacterium]|nr:helicase associated domain-containing protein [Actinomycetota bacterium]
MLHGQGRLPLDRLAALESLPGWCWDARQAAWDEGFARLEAFVVREGHARPSLRWREDCFCLGHWVANQRVARRADRLEGDRVARLETLAGWWWNPTVDRWEEYFNALETFCAHSGHASPAQSHREGDLALGAWVARQRDRWRAGRLPVAHHERLRALPGWSFEVNEDRWDRYFHAVEAYAVRFGTARMSSAATQDGLRIGGWVAQQRQAWSSGGLDERRAKLLADLPGWIWQPHVEAWEDMFAALVVFVEREGHARVPKTHVESCGPGGEVLGLGAWVSRQRRMMAAGRLTADQARRLSQLPGWCNNLRLDRWTTGLRALDAFVARERHATVPQRHVEGGHRLGSWVGKQRCSRAEGTLAEERVRRLEQYPGWLWDTNEGAWDQGYAFLRSHVERFGHARVRYDHLEGDEGFKLGQWCDVQRSTFRKGTLATDRIARMEALTGWVWDVRAAKWEESFAVLCRRVVRTGMSAVPGHCMEDGFALGTWVKVQRRAYSDGSIESSRIPRLEALAGWTWRADTSGRGAMAS